MDKRLMKAAKVLHNMSEERQNWIHENSDKWYVSDAKINQAIIERDTYLTAALKVIELEK